MNEENKLSCSNCGVLACRYKDEAKYPKFCLTAATSEEKVQEALQIYLNDKELLKTAQVSAGIEGDFFGRLTRVEETIEFIKRMGYKKIGIASCVGLMYETRLFSDILRGHKIDHVVVGCKIGAVDKSVVGVPDQQKLNRGCGHESMCNPILQAKYLEEQGTEFNIVIGLCVGHDTLFLKHTKAPTTVMVVKDRVLQHNPAAALYGSKSMYSRFKEVVPTP